MLKKEIKINFPVLFYLLFEIIAKENIKVKEVEKEYKAEIKIERERDTSREKQ